MHETVPPARSVKRRTFLQRVAGLGATGLGGAVLARAEETPAPGQNRGGDRPERVRVGYIGVGGRGTTHLRTMLELEGAEITAVCDIDPTALDRAAKLVAAGPRKKTPATYENYRRLLESKDVDDPSDNVEACNSSATLSNFYLHMARQDDPVYEAMIDQRMRAGFVIPLKKKNVKRYKKMATIGCKVWMEHGALSYYECVGANLASPFGGIPFPKLCKLKKDETVVFAFVVYKSKAHRNAVNKRIMKDPRILKMMKMKPIFDDKRMSYGGFKAIVDL